MDDEGTTLRHSGKAEFDRVCHGHVPNNSPRILKVVQWIDYRKEVVSLSLAPVGSHAAFFVTRNSRRCVFLEGCSWWTM